MTDPTAQPLDLDAIQALSDAATPGPWCTDSWEIYQGTEYEPGLSMWIGETCRGTSSLEQDRADAAFVAAARTAMPALVAEIHRLRAELATALRPDTPRLCECGHSNHAHTVPAPHSCFAYGKTCPCPAYRQLPHDEAVAQLLRNQQAAAERAAAEETHVVADDSDDPEHVDDCPGCEPAARPAPAA